MIGTGAIFLYDNAIDRLDQFISDGRIDVPANLTSDQLAPVGSFLGLTEMEFRFTGAESIDAVQIMGVNLPDLVNFPVVTVERWDGSGWAEVAASWIVSETTPFTPSHLIGILDATAATTRMRVSIVVPSQTVQIGCIRFAKLLQDRELADQGWSSEPLDVAVVDASQGGQLYASGSAVRRRFTIPQKNIREAIAHGTPAERSPIALPAAAVVNATQDGDTFTTSGNLSGQITWAGALEIGVDYLLDTEVRVTGQGTSLDVPSISLQLGTSIDIGQGRRSLHFRATSADLQINISVPAGGADSASLQLLGLDKTTTDPAAPDRSLDQLIAISGTSKPITAILRPTDPTSTAYSTIYGLVERYQPYEENEGPNTAGGLTIIESL